MKAFIAVDGGGSKTELVLVDILGNVLMREIVNCTNPNDVGMDSAFLTLKHGLEKMLEFVENKEIDILKIFLLIAGIEFGDSKELLKQRLVESLNFENIYIDGDLASVKESGLKDKDNGVVIISGTGFNMAIKRNNEFRNIGGWGYLADDYLSGFDLGKDALIRASNAINGVGKETILVDMLEKHFSNTLWFSMKEIYDSGIKGVASLSKIVIEAYKLNDVVAKEIVDSRVNKLAKIIKMNTKKIVGNIDVVLFGGIFENNPLIVEKLSKKLSKKYILKVSNEKTIYGAISLGYRDLKLNNKEFYLNFDNSYKGVIS